MKKLSPFVFVGLLGCTQTYVPAALSIDNQELYQQDVLFCQTASQKYSPSFDGNSVILGFVQGGAQNISISVLNPVMTLVGAGGGAVSSGAQTIDLFGQAKTNVFKNCLHDKTLMDKSALMANPN